MEIKVSSQQLLITGFIFFMVLSYQQFLVLCCVSLVEIQTNLTFAAAVVVVVISCTQTGGEEAATGQAAPSPRPGQAPENEKEEGLPGKVRGQTKCP